GKPFAAIGNHRGACALFRVIHRSRRVRSIPSLPFRLRRRVGVLLARQGIGLGPEAPVEPIELRPCNTRGRRGSAALAPVLAGAVGTLPFLLVARFGHGCPRTEVNRKSLPNTETAGGSRRWQDLQSRV